MEVNWEVAGKHVWNMAEASFEVMYKAAECGFVFHAIDLMGDICCMGTVAAVSHFTLGIFLIIGSVYYFVLDQRSLKNQSALFKELHENMQEGPIISRGVQDNCLIRWSKCSADEIALCLKMATIVIGGGVCLSNFSMPVTFVVAASAKYIFSNM